MSKNYTHKRPVRMNAVVAGIKLAYEDVVYTPYELEEAYEELYAYEEELKEIERSMRRRSRSKVVKPVEVRFDEAESGQLYFSLAA